MFLFNKNARVIEVVKEYYKGNVYQIPFNQKDLSNALEYTKKHRSDYSDDMIAKLSTIYQMLKK